MKKILFFLLLIIVSSLQCQEKLEREYRIKSTEAPNKALDFIDKLNLPKKVKWYVEASNEGKTFEAKTCFENHLFSVEFSEKGILIDVEMKTSFSKIEASVKEKITKTFKDRFDKYRIKKTQFQYRGLQKELTKLFVKYYNNTIEVDVFYEIVVKGKKDKNYELYEFLFDAKGDLVKSLKFAIPNSDNLQF